ncbi:MAG: hypothetical protein R2738_06955 [Bacteroides graminisolvens]
MRRFNCDLGLTNLIDVKDEVEDIFGTASQREKQTSALTIGYKF